MLILSTERTPWWRARAEKLGVECAQGIADKGAVLREWAAARGIHLDRIAYLGNDVNDLPCLGLVGWPVAVADAHPRCSPPPAHVAAAARAATAPCENSPTSSSEPAARAPRPAPRTRRNERMTARAHRPDR